MASTKIVPVVGLVGTGSGISLGVFISEVVARSTGQTGWAKFGLKALVKGLLFGALFLVSGRLGGLWSFGVELASYGVVGSVIPDAFEAAMAGGLIGAAEAVASTIRTSAVGVRKANGKVSDEQAAQIESESWLVQ